MPDPPSATQVECSFTLAGAAAEAQAPPNKVLDEVPGDTLELDLDTVIATLAPQRIERPALMTWSDEAGHVPVAEGEPAA